jgi:hypothetical protein
MRKQAYVEGVLGGQGRQQLEPASSAAAAQLEAGLASLEDATLIAVCGASYLLAGEAAGRGPLGSAAAGAQQQPRQPASPRQQQQQQQHDGAAWALARMARLPLGAQVGAMGRDLLLHRRMHEGMVEAAAAVLQRVWRARRARGGAVRPQRC